MASILVVDDEPAIRASLQMILQKAGHRIAEAVDGHDALRRFASGDFDLVITDVIMPNEEGIGLIRRLRSESPHVKILAMSGGGRTANMNFLDMALELGADGVLKKPFDATEIRRAVERLLAPAAPPPKSDPP